VNEDNLSNAGWKLADISGTKKGIFERTNELQSNRKSKNIRELFTAQMNLRTNFKNNETGDLLVDPHKILNRWKNYFCQLLNVHGAGGVRQTEMHTAEPFVPQPSASEAEVATGMLKRYKSPGVDQIPAELIQAGGEILHSEIHKLTKLIWNKKHCLTSGKGQLWYQFTNRAIKLTAVIIEAYHCCQLHTKFY
jgi:hypothetical protein